MDNTVKKTVDNLAETLGRAGLGDRGRGPYPEQLLFKPPLGSKASQSLGDIPNYLFRVVSPKSAGKTNRMWARSESARQHEISSTKDIFSFKGPEDRQTKAFELTVHLQWYGDIYEAEDNFVSWTSSLLFAIQYIYYRHHHDIPGPSLNDIQLYVIDTSLFPRGTFMRDLDLIESFREFDRENTSGQYWNLKSLHSLRTTKGFYFGEYLSQGSLKIENKCRKIPAKILFDNNRLRRLQPAFNKLYMPPPCRKDTKWAKAVIDVRKAIWPPILPVLSSLEISDRLAALKEILDTMDTYDSQHGWTFPLGIYLAALAGFGPATDTHTESCGLFFEKFQSATWGDIEFKPFDFNIVAPDTMPELKHAQALLRETNKHFQLNETLDTARQAERKIRNLYIKALENGALFFRTDQNEFLRQIGEQVERKLRDIRGLCDEIVSAMAISEE